MVRAFIRDISGATALEQALVTAFVALVTLGVLALCGARLYAVFASAADAFTSGGSAATPR